MSTPEPKVVISGRGEERVRSGHPWIYRTDVEKAKMSSQTAEVDEI